MDAPNNADLQDALQDKDNWERAFAKLLEDVGPGYAKQVANIARGADPQGLTPEELESVAQLLNGRGFIEDAEAQIAKLRGFPEAAAYHEMQRDLFWERRNGIRTRL